jgi:hypothetical protein
MQYRVQRAGAAVLALGLLACSPAPAPVESEEPPARVEVVEGTELSRLMLTERAAARLGIRTAPVERVAGRPSWTTVPYSAVLYAPDGETWIYISTEPLTYIRHAVVVDRIDGQLAVLSKGPPVDTQVVTVGVAELYGTEFEVGH